MSRPAPVRWPFANLDAALRQAGYTLRWQKINALSIPERTWFRWRRDGVPEMAADAAAAALDSHPVLIWGRAWETGVPPAADMPPLPPRLPQDRRERPDSTGPPDHPTQDRTRPHSGPTGFGSAPISETDLAC